jgi:DNA-binding response OmpR family regulator
MPLRVAILDNDAAEVASLRNALSAYHCQAFHTPSELTQRGHAIAIEADLFLLDVQTLQRQPEIGAALVAKLCNSDATPPVLLCAGRNDTAALLQALHAGANDYVIKPLRVGEILLRVQILLKRAYPAYQDQQQFRFARYVFETPSNRVTRDGVSVDMTQKEFELALLLFGNLGRPLSRAYIQDAIWSRDADLPSRTMDTHVSRVRNKLQLKPEHGFRLAPVYGYGYQLEQIGA